MQLKTTLLVLFTLFFGKANFAAHLMGGEITWQALGGSNYQFKLVIYRDCNGLDIIDPSLNIRVWGHPVVTDITCAFFSSTDLSPTCSAVVGGPAEIDCGVGSGGGTGPGAIQQYIYRSGVVVLSGTPPASGWAFTYDSFSRNFDLDNIDEPYAYGFTLSSIMYPLPDACLDSSPEFAQDPYMLLCEGSDFQFNSNAYDKDNDSLVFSWGIPLDHFPAGSFNPPVNPGPVPFLAGYAFNNPTPDASFNAGNIPASMDPSTGQITFKSFTPGNFGFVQKIDCYRGGVLIATINRESQLVIIPCPGYTNTPPTITPPFAGGTTFEAEFFAGDLINFDIIISDLEFLQDGSPQTVTLLPTGNYFGTGLTDDATGCDYLPCATLDTSPIIQGVQGLTTNFNWQTSCDHLNDACGVQQAEQVYTFVLNAQDDYCAVPGRTYETVRITLKNKLPLEPVQLTCADVLDNGDVVLSWIPTSDVSGSFVNYEIHSVGGGLITTIPTIVTNSYTVTGAAADIAARNYFVITSFGCGGSNNVSSDTLSTMFMDFTDLTDGRVLLDWNSTHVPINTGESSMHQIYREFPVGTWTLRGEVPYGTNAFVDTIDICEDFLSYEIRVNHISGCTSTSNKEGQLLKDKINPIIPVLNWVSVNPISEYVDMSWNVNPSEDTYGYIISKFVTPGWPSVDTVWGRFNTNYTYVPTESGMGVESFRISAFDSCFTTIIPPTYQTSASSPPHSTIYLKKDYNLCDQSISLSWTPYAGWLEEVLKYEVLVSIAGLPYEVIGTITSADLSFVHKNVIYDVNYCYYVRATSTLDTISLSNKVCQVADRPSQPEFHYLATASHLLTNEIEVVCYTDGTAAVEKYEVEVMGPYDYDFEVIGEQDALVGSLFTFIDTEVFPERGAYQYRINLIDTCGRVGNVSNIGKTVFLEVETDHVKLLHTLNWSAYSGFDGNIIRYDIYRGENGVFDATPIGSTLPGVRSYVDDVSSFYNSQGQFCYRVEAIEGVNSYGFNQTSFSNAVCAVVDPLVYIPNAFLINGENNIFLPIVSLYDFDSYSLTIYNRWGEQIFISSDRYEGWNGENLLFGGYHEEGVYVYHLTFTDREGNEYDYQGTVTLLIGEE